MTAATKPKVRKEMRWVLRPGGGCTRKPCLVITNLPKGVSAKKLKRLVEIAACRYNAKGIISHAICNGGNWSYGNQPHPDTLADAVLSAIGLTPPARRKDGKK